MDLGRAPERVLKAHSSDQVANLLIDPRSATERAGLPSPVSGESHSVPAHDRLGPDDGYGIQDARKAAIKPNEQNPIGPTQIQSTRRAPSKHGQLMTQNHNFGFKSRSRLEAVAQHADEKQGNCDHQPQLCCDSPTAATPPDEVFGSDNSREKPSNKAAPSLPQGKLNAIRAAFKAGVKPSQIARQFGVSQSDVRKALASDDG
jgi:hypothetical protein